MPRTKTDEWYRRQARALYVNDGEVEVDPDAVVSRSNDPESHGAYVQAWLWVGSAEENLIKARMQLRSIQQVIADYERHLAELKEGLDAL